MRTVASRQKIASTFPIPPGCTSLITESYGTLTVNDLKSTLPAETVNTLLYGFMPPETVNPEVAVIPATVNPDQLDPAKYTFSTQSILFSTHADLGLLSANDKGLPTLQVPSSYPQLELPSHESIVSNQQQGISSTILPEQFGSIPAEFFGIAAANEDAEPCLDDYFPDIL